MIGADLTRCATCGKRFGSYHSMQQHAQAVHGTGRDDFTFLYRYWNDPAFREEAEAERARKQAELNAQIDAAQRRAWQKMGMTRT